MQLKNTGDLTLTDVNVTTPAAILSTNCGTTATLAPGEIKQCTLTATATQDSYDAGTLSLEATGVAGHQGDQAITTLGGTLTQTDSITLNNSASLSLTVQTASAITKAGEALVLVRPVCSESCPDACAWAKLWPRDECMQRCPMFDPTGVNGRC
jgi:hypothetical protein